jgi:predicted dehydrogenase
LVTQGKSKTQRFPSQDKGHKAEMSALITALLSGAPEPIPFQESVEATQATFAIIHSIQTGTAINLA